MTNIEYYKNIEVPLVNKERPRTPFISHDEREEAIKNLTTFDRTPYYIEYPKIIPDDIATNVHHSDPNWSEIDVPGNWKLQWHGTAIYTNGNYDFCPKNPVPPDIELLKRTGSILTEPLPLLLLVPLIPRCILLLRESWAVRTYRALTGTTGAPLK